MMGYPGDVAFDYVYDNQLTADGTYANEGVRTETDSDFLLYGFTANSYTSILILLQFRDSGGNFFSHSAIAGSQASHFRNCSAVIIIVPPLRRGWPQSIF